MEYEILKVQIPKDLAEKFRKWVALKYGFKKGALSKAIEDLIRKELENEIIDFDLRKLVGLLKEEKIRNKDLAELALEIAKND